MKRFFFLLHFILVHAMVALLLLTPSTLSGDILRMNASAGGGSAAVPGAAGAADANAINTAAAAAQARVNANDMLARNTMALQAVTAMQEAARALAATSNNLGANPNGPGGLPDVPNATVGAGSKGFVPGGLEIIGSPAGANILASSQENARAIVNIQQTQQQALLDWKTFNVGRETTVRFDQSAGGASAATWIAFNRVTDPSGNPTQILGSIEAQGQVYIINQNGIIFGGTSVVNTGSLVASALPINDNLVTRGLLNNPDSQFLFSANAQPAGSKGPTPAYTPPALPNTTGNRIGNVTVQAGARITAPTSSANVGGRVALIGPNVTNAGTISTPDGQTVLAAGMEVGFDAHSSDDPSLRGLDVFVGDVGSYGGTATNAGLIEAPRGSVLITGKSVNQNGFINSTTSAALNGRVDLLAQYNAISNTNYTPSDATFGRPFVYRSSISTGVVRTGAGSVVQILPEYSSALKVAGTELALKSQVNMLGLGVYLGQGSVVLAPNANVVISAGVWDLLLTTGITEQTFVNSSGQVYLDRGAVINVAGSVGIAASIDQYLLTVTLRGAELADSALQRNGVLRGSEVKVDLRKHGTRSDGTEWVGTPLANLAGYLNVIERNVGQLTVAGGTVAMNAGESVVMQEGAVVDVSSGYLEFPAGYVETSRLRVGNTLVDIADARLDALYDGVYDPTSATLDSRWGGGTSSTAVFTPMAHYEDAHTYGARTAGGIQLAAASMALDGSFRGNTVTGTQQLADAPALSSLTLLFRSQQLKRTPMRYPFHSPTPPDIKFRLGATGLPAADPFSLNGSGEPTELRPERRAEVVLSPELLSMQGFGHLTVDNSDGEILLPRGVALTAPATGTIILRGANLDIQGSILAPAGQISLTAYNVSPYTTAIIGAEGPLAVIPPVHPTRGRVTVRASAVLSAAGLVVDDRVGSAAASTVPLTVLTSTGAHRSTTAGGTIGIDAHVADVLAGSLLDVSGGFHMDQNGDVEYANAGSITLQAGRDPLLTSLLGGRLKLEGRLQGLSGAVGGSLSLLAPLIQIGGAATLAEKTVLLAPEFFSSGGFTRYKLTGLGVDISPPGGSELFAPGVLLSAGTVLQPVAHSLQVSVNPQGGAVQADTLLKAEGYRSPVSLDFEAPGVLDFVTSLMVLRGGVKLGSGSFIGLDALGSVKINAQTAEVLGTIVAPGGTVSITGAGAFPSNTLPTTAFATVHLGGAARISTAGKVVLLENAYGRRVGSVHNGGSITVSGNIVAAAGLLLDVSGTSGVLDLLFQEAGMSGEQAAISPATGVTAAPQLALGSSVASRIDSNAGNISLMGSEFLFSAATLVGQAGGPNGQGGTLTVSSGRFIAPGASSDDKDINLRVAQDISAFTQPVFVPGQDVVGQALGGGIVNLGYVGVNSFQNGGLDSLTLAGNVQFSGPASISARAALKVASGGVLAADALTQLSASYVALGRPLIKPTRDEELLNPYIRSLPGIGEELSYFSPVFATGRLEVSAEHIDTGFLSLQNIGQASLTARQDLRGNGYLDIAGHLTITAGQVYPTTASTFTITAYNYTDGGVPTNGSVTLLSSGQTPEFPLSGGGRLNIFASTITQGGMLRAPLGSIRLGWDGSGAAPKGLVTNMNVPVTQQVNLAAGSVTAVSAIDPQTGLGVTIPYGLVKDGTNWIDPTGLDITSTGVPAKSVRISADNVTTAAGSLIDIRGGGELYGYRWVQGNGGTQDVLSRSTSFAILPGYHSAVAPFGAFAEVGLFADNLGGDIGYVNGGLAIGDQIFLQGSDLLSAGVYTLLPARYALLPGAMLVTPESVGIISPSQVKPGGAQITSGYRFNSLNPSVTGAIYQQFEIAPQQVIRARSEFTDFAASSFIPVAQQRLSLPLTRVPLDAGRAVLSAVSNMQLLGNLTAGGALTGRGGLVDVSSPLEIILAAPGAALQPGKLVLNTTLLSSWEAESLLIGGERSLASGITSVNVRTGKLTLDNAGAPLRGKDVILAATGVMNLAPGAVIRQSGVPASVDALVTNGNGALVRVSGLASAAFSRTAVTASVLPALNVGAGVLLDGAGLTLDSTNATTLDPTAILQGQTINLSSGQISVQLTHPGTLQPTTGLVLGGAVLTGLQNTAALSLLSYSSLDFYGTGLFANTGSLALRAGEIRGFNQGAGTVNIAASGILLDNNANGVAPGVVAGVSGALEITADTITIGKNVLMVSQYATVGLNAAHGMVMQGAGSFRTRGALNVVTPFITATTSATQSLIADGDLNLTRPAGPPETPSSPGMGAQVAFEGASITANSDVYLPSGLLSMRARTGALNIGGRLDAGGTAKVFFDQVRYTDAGQINLTANLGNVTLTPSGVINLAAAPQSGDAGTLTVSAAAGLLTLDGTLLGQNGLNGKGASADLDVGSLASFTALNDKFNNGGFTQSRALRLRSGSLTIDSTVNARRFLLGVDQGSITVNGTINAAGQTGGRIDLIANGDVTVNSGAMLTVAAQDFDNAGKGGSITLESGAQRLGVLGTGRVKLQTGSTLNLSVASKVAGDATPANNSDFQGKFSGKLHIRAPQNSTFNDVLVDPINGTILDASSILVEGYRLYDLTGSGVISTTVQNSIHTNSVSFMGTAGATVPNYTAMTDRLLANNAGLRPVFVLAPGAEIVNRTGNLTLGTSTSAASSDWNLATFRYGAKSAPGVLTLRASGNLEFYNTLSDGFTVATSGSIPIVERMWMAQLTARNNNLPVNTQSWNYRMAAGADFSAVNFREVTPLAGLGAGTGSLLLGKDAGQAIPATAGINSAPGTNALTRLAINPTNNTATTGSPNATNRFQVIRTGTGEIEIFSGRDVQLLNQFATIYTAGVTVPSVTTVFTAGDFVAPIVAPVVGNTPVQGDTLGAVQQLYPAQYSMAGGNVSVSAQADIVHLTKDVGGNLILDSQRQLPNNWLMRRGYVDSGGAYGATVVSGGGLQRINDVAASTSWWVNFSNFFDGIAALGGGNVNLAAGNDVQNVGAHTPTNARAARGTPSAAGLLELGGGDLTVRAGRNIDGGVFYVQRGTGVLQADGAITTNSTRSPSLGRLGAFANILPEDTWLPTTLFVGNSTFDVSARGDILLGPVANTTLLPQGVNNKHWYKTYFSTYTAESGLSVDSLGGDITFRQAATLTQVSTPVSMLTLWMNNELLLTSNSAAFYHPWLRLIETNVDPFSTLANLMPGTLRASAYSGDINLVGGMTFAPSPTGTLELLAGGSLNGLRPSGVSSSIIAGAQTNVWTASTLNLSDANPAAIPGVLSPFAYYQTYFNPATPTNNSTARLTGNIFLNGINALFNESGSTTGNFASTQAKQTLHASGLLHAADTTPARLYAAGGDLSGFTLFSAKSARILSDRDISDIEFYIQNMRSSDLSVVSAGRDIIAYNANSVLRSQAVSTGNLTAIGEIPKSGDIQINGPGTLQVLAGRDINLGTGSNNSDGTGIGITSIGNGRNPYLPFEGADVIIGAGLGRVAAGLGGSQLDFAKLITDFSTPRNLADLAELLGVNSVDLNDPALTAEQQKKLAMGLFYVALRNAGRDRNDPESPDVGTYAAGYAAIDAFIPASIGSGSIQTQARDIRTKSGGDISIFVPGGGLQLAPSLIGETLAPPGIITESGGNLSVFTHNDVNIGISRIFTLRGGDITIWSSIGNIAAGSSSKTVQSAPPTRVLIDPQSASVATDLAGLATGGGIGVLATVAGIAPGNVDLIAPIGAVDAGDAGIRATGNLNIAASIVLNAGNISVGGASAGTPAAPAVASPSLGGLASAASAGAAATSTATNQSDQQKQAQQTTSQELPSIISVEVIGYGGGSGEDERKRNEPGE
ncbi:MAG: filamentous hemagglutinin family protein [Verrucomicrobia bacterium]|nr:filamentous hemagglutinin family protein [Verrucomicrobiota bacterium]